MKQNKQKGSIGIVEVFFITIFLIIIIWVLQLSQEDDINRLEKHDSCLTQAITELPDPNDTTERSILLENCMDK